MANTIDVGMDVSQLRAAALEMQSALNGAASATLKLATESVTLDETLQAKKATITAVTEAGIKLTAQVEESAGVFKVLSIAVKGSNEDLKAIKATVKETTDSLYQQQLAADRLGQSLDKAFARGRKASDSQSAKYDKKAASNASDDEAVAAQQAARLQSINALFGRSSAIDNSGLNSTKASVKELSSSLKEAGDSGKSAGEKISISWQGVVRLFETQILRQVIRGLITQFLSAIPAAEQFSIAVAQLQGVSQSAGVSTQQWSTQLRGLADQFGQNETTVAKAAYAAIQSQLVTAANATGLLSTALKFGNVTGLEAVESTKLLTNTLNAFKLPAAEGERVANILFKTIAGGAVSAHELGTEFQKLASTAGGSNVKLEEVAAAVETLVNKGLKFSDATSVITGLLTQTIKPTKNLKEAFLEMGATSGEALIQMKGGLGGYLDFLDHESQRGNSRLAELVGSFRNIRGSLNITGQAFAEYGNNLAKVSNNTGELNKANDILDQSLGQKLKVELNKVKTYFSDVLGQELISEILKVSKFIGGDEGMVGAVKKLVTIAKEAIIVFVAFKAGQLGAAGFNILVAGYTAVASRIASYTVGVRAATIAQQQFNVATSANIIGAGVVAGVALGQYINSFENPDNRADADTIRERGRVNTKKDLDSKSDDVDAERKNQNIIIDEVQRSSDEKYRIILAYTGKVVKLSESLRDKATDNLKEISQQVQITSKTFTDAISKDIADLTKKLNEYQQGVKGSKKFLEDLDRQSSGQIFKIKEKFAATAENDGRGNIAPNRFINGQNVGADQRLTLAQERADKLLQEAREKFKSGSKEDVEEARRLFKEVEKLQEEIFTKGVENQKKALADAVANGYSPDQIRQPRNVGDGSTRVIDGNKPYPAQDGLGDSKVVRRIGPDGKPRIDLLVQTAGLEKQINTLNEERIALEKQYQAEKQKGIVQKEVEIAKEKERLRTVQQGLQEAAKFTVLDKDGQVKKEFKDDPALAGRKFQEIVDKINTAAGPEAVSGQFQFFADLYKQRAAVVQQVELAIRAEQAKTGQEAIIQDKKTADAKIASARADLDKSRAIIDPAIEKIGGILENLKTNVLGSKDTDGNGRAYADPGSAKGIAQRANPFQGGDAFKEDAVVAKAEPARLEAIKKLDEAIAAKTAVLQNNTQANADTLIQKIQELKSATAAFIALRTGGTIDNQAGPNDRTSGRVVGKDLKDATGASNAIQQGIDLLTKANTTIGEVKKKNEDLFESVLKIPGSLAGIAPAAEGAKGAIRDSFNAMKGDTDALINKFKELETALGRLKTDLPAVRGNRPEDPSAGATPYVGDAEGRMFGGTTPQYFAGGGGVNWKPRGSDRIPAMLAKDEFVVNAQAAAQFKPQLEAINNFQQPRYMASGGSVTNVGDINVNVSGGDTSTKTVREIATGLRRELRRGTVTLQ